MRYIKQSLLMLLLVLGLAACSGTADAIVDYNNDFIIKDFREENERFIELLDEYDEVALEGDLEDQILYSESEIIPHAKKLVAMVRDRELGDDVLQDAHDHLIEYNELRLQAFEAELEYLMGDEEDEDLLDKAFDLIDDSVDALVKFEEEFDALVDEYDLEEEEI